MNARILVTGATGGVGEVVVRKLVANGDHVVAHARDRAALETLVSALGAENVTPVVADLSSLAEVKRLASEVGSLDALINNAGVGFGSDKTKRETSRDGFELRFAVNYLAPFLLTEQLIGADTQTKLRTIVNVASIGQAPLDESDLMNERNYDGVLTYRRSKLALIMDTFDRAARDTTRRYVTLHPGTFLATKMVIEAGITPLGKAEDGGDAVMHAFDAANHGKTGAYFDVKRETRASEPAYDQAAQARLRETAKKLLASI